MTKTNLTLHVCLYKTRYQNDWYPIVLLDEPAAIDGTLYEVIERRVITVEIPDQAEMVGLEIEGLRKLIQQERAKSARRVAEMEDKIGKLQSLTHQQEG